MPEKEPRFTREGHTEIKDPLEAQRAEQYVYLMEHVNDVVGPLQVELDALQPSVLDDDPVALEAWKQTDTEIRKIIKTIQAFPPDHELRQKFAANEDAVRHLLSSYLAKKESYERQKKLEKESVTRPMFETSELIPDDLMKDYVPLAPSPASRPSPKEGLSMDVDEEIENVPGNAEDVEMDLESYKAELGRIYEEVQMIALLLKEKGGKMLSAKKYHSDGSVSTEERNITEEMLQALMGFQMRLPELNRKAGYPKTKLTGKIEGDIMDVVEKAMQQYANQKFEHSPGPRKIEPKLSAAWMPRVPMAPYRARMVNAGRRRFATLTATTAALNGSSSTTDTSEQAVPAPMPTVTAPDMSQLQLPDNYKELPDKEKTKAMQELLNKIEQERDRIVGEHDAVISRLTEEIKERKLEELRASLKS